MPKDAYVEVEGYECAFLPSKEDFDGGVYTVAKNLLHPKPVAVEIPALESGVTCRIDGVVAAGAVVLAPGRHVVAYSRDGKSTQRFEFAFGVGEKPSLPPPGEWKDVGFFESAYKAVSDSVQGGIEAVNKSLENSRVESLRQGGR